MSEQIPAEIIAEFRSLALERLANIETSWHEVISEPDGELGINIEREVHNLKGDSRLVGFHDVSVLCHKMEDLLRFARAWGYRVPETIDLLVAAVIGFIRLLLHKRIGQPMAGLDLAEFSRQIDDALREAYLLPAPLSEAMERENRIGGVKNHSQISGRVTEATIARLAAAATDVYLHHLNVRGDTRVALRRAWLKLVDEIRQMRSIPLTVVLSRQATAAREICQRLQKRVDFTLQTNGLWIGPTMAPVIDMAVTHAVTNAIDHGIEPPGVRQEAGKGETGRVRVSGSMQGDQVELIIEDDGGGVDVDLVRRRAIACGLMSAEHAESLADASVLELLMHPSFSTRDSATQTSGRGFGLDAVRTALQRHGGRIRLEGKAGQGLRVILQFPQDRHEIPVHVFNVAGSAVRFAVESSWQITTGPGTRPTIDPLEALGLISEGDLEGDPPGTTPATPTTPLLLRRGQKEVTLLVSGRVTSLVAERICPVGEELVSAEVILLKDGEALLLYPERLRA